MSENSLSLSHLLVPFLLCPNIYEIVYTTFVIAVVLPVQYEAEMCSYHKYPKSHHCFL